MNYDNWLLRVMQYAILFYYSIYSFKMGKQIENYSLQLQLGNGVYSRVFKAINMITKQQVAIKMVKADKFKELPKLQEGTINEINTLTSLKPCPNIIRYYDMLKTVNNFYFVYEYCNGGTLEKVLKTNKFLGEKQSLIYFRQLITAFKILAENHIMHRDIKPENILVHNGILKVADFGFCKPLEHQDGMADTMLGSPIYMAPEVLKGQPYTMKADVWSLGVVLYRMLFGICPFESNNIGKLILILNENEMKIPENPNISPIVEDLIRRMLTKDPKKRADWNQVFTFQITQTGEMYDTKNHITGSLDSLKASTANSWGSNKTPYSREDDIQVKKVRKVQSPQHSDCKMQKTNPNKLNLLVEPSLRETFKSKSPLRGTINNNRYSKKQVNIKNHKKCIQLTSMVMEVVLYDSPDAVAVAYFLCKNIQKQFFMLRQSLKKQGLPSNINSSHSRSGEDSFLNDLNSIVSEQMKCLTQLIFSFESALTDFGIKGFEVIESKNKYLKRFITSIKNLQSKEQLSLCHQLLDYILEDILINKKTYQKLNCEQMYKKIKDKLHQIA